MGHKPSKRYQCDRQTRIENRLNHDRTVEVATDPRIPLLTHTLSYESDEDKWSQALASLGTISGSHEFVLRGQALKDNPVACYSDWVALVEQAVQAGLVQPNQMR